MQNPTFLRHVLVLFFSLIFLGEGFGQIDIVNEDLGSGLPSGWTASSVSFYSYARFTSSANSVLTSPILDLSNYTGVTLEFEVAKYGTGGDGPLTVEFSDDGGSTWTAQIFDSPTPTSSTYITSGPTSISVSGSNVQFRFIRTSSSSAKRLTDILLRGILNNCSAEPTTQASNIVFTDNSSTSVDVSWDAGVGGNEYILMAREASAVGFTPADGIDYTGDTGGGDFSTATDQGSGNKIVYSNSGTSTTITGLTAGTTYYFQVFAVCTNSSYDYLISTGTGNDGTQNYTVPLLITDDACGVDDLESTFVFSGGSVIGDVNLFVAISHPWRGDLRIELVSPSLTTVQVLDGVGSGADNLEVIFDDEAVVTLAGGNHTVDGVEDQTVNSTADLLGLFDGEDPNGTWILRVCDDGNGDIGSLIDWSLDIQPGAPPCAAQPIVQATAINFTDNSSTSVDVDWTAGIGGDEYILVGREANAISFTPTDGIDYSGAIGGGDFTLATDQGSGNKVVYSGSGASTTVTGLIAGTTYYFQVFVVCTGDSYNYLTSIGTGNDGTQNYTPPLLIPDNGCGSNELESTIEFSGGSIIGDVNLFVAISHPFRADLRIELESPDGTVVQLLDGSTGGSADNLEVIFDDEAGSTINTTNHTINGTEDQTVTSTTNLLSDFDFEDPNGIWILRICDDGAADIGSLIDWSLDIDILVIQPEPTNHPTAFGCFAFGSSEIDLIWDDATGGQIPDGYLILWSDIDFASILPIPVDGTPIPDGSNALNVSSTIESAAIMGLTQNTDYYFLVYPYTNSGSVIDYKTNGTIPGTTCITDPGPCAFETFDNAGNVGSYDLIPWIGDNGVQWNATDARSDQDLNGDEAIMLQNGSLTNTTTVPGGCGEISFNYARIYAGNSTLKVYVNGVQYGGDISVTSTSSSLFSAIVNIGGPITVELENSGNRTLISNLAWTCSAGCSPTQTISGFTPLSGPANTLVTIIGTGFTGATDVLIGGVSASSFTEVSDTELTALVATGSLTGQIEVIVGGCGRLSTEDFEFLDQNVNCGGAGGGPGSYATDLFISEVYDAQSGSLSYVEIFNGTPLPVDLGAESYVLRINTGAINDYNLIGNVNSGDTYIIRLGGGSSLCSNFSPDFTPSPSQGFNGDDLVILRKAGIDLDYVPNPYSSQNPGFSQSRNNTVTGPSNSFIPSQWTVSGNENCSDLGLPPYTPSGNNITINNHPTNVNCSTLTFTVARTSTTGFTGNGAFTWRCLPPGASTWELVSGLNGSNGITVIGSNTPSITISGNTSILIDYQFYVDMGTGGSPECRKYSDAATYSYDTRIYYRTKGSGSWTDINTWEMSDTELGLYTSPICETPSAFNSDKVIIRSGNSVNISGVDIVLDWVVIESGGTLSIDNLTKVEINDGNLSGADFQVDGTWIDNGTSGNGINLSNTGAEWTLGSAGTLIKTNTSSTVQYRDNYEGGITMIPASSTWIYRRVSAVNLAIVSTGMTYPNLYFENDVSGNYSPTSTIHNFSGSSNSIEIKGDLSIGVSGAGNFNLRTNNTHANPILVKGDLYIGANSSLNNQSSSTDYGSGFELLGDLSINGLLDLSGGTGSGIGVLQLSGDQDVIGIGGTTVMVNHFVMDKGIGFNGLTDLSFDIEESAQFINGIVELDNAANRFSFGTNATATGADNASYIDGRVQKVANTSTNFTYPIGDSNADGNFYQPSRIFGLIGGTATFEAQYFLEEHPLAGAYYDGESNTLGDNQEIGNCDYWTLNKIGIGGNVQLALKYTNDDTDYCNVVNDETFMRIASLNPSNNWDLTDSGNSGDEIVMGVEITAPSTGGTYGDFAFSSTGGALLNVLPIELLFFDAEAIRSTVVTKWSTSTETNNDFFTVERSADAQVFRPIANIDGAGTSHSTRHYSYVDENPLPGVSYYRLKQTDFDDMFSYSDIRAVTFEGEDGFDLTLVYRNESALNLVYKSTSPIVLVEIFDVLGKRLFAENAENFGGRSVLDVNLRRGAYVVRISSGENSDTMKMVW